MKILTKISHYIFGKPKDKYRIYRKGNGQYHVTYGPTIYTTDTLLHHISFAILDSVAECEAAIDRHKKRILQKKCDNKVTFIKEIT